jgi:hypothetical protein
MMTDFPRYATEFAPVVIEGMDRLALLREHARSDQQAVSVTRADAISGTTAVLLLGTPNAIDVVLDRLYP